MGLGKEEYRQAQGKDSFSDAGAKQLVSPPMEKRQLGCRRARKTSNPLSCPLSAKGLFEIMFGRGEVAQGLAPWMGPDPAREYSRLQ
jgi:hypothetical protein